MKRSSYLRDLSSDHHQALNLAREILKEFSGNSSMEPLIARVRRDYREKLAPHFEREEQTILPELKKLGESALVERTLEDHRLLGHLIEHLDDPSAILEFAAALKAHVRFEERILFQTMQRIWDEKGVE